MNGWDADAVRAESAKWRSPWVPPAAREVDTEQVHLYIQDGTASLIRVKDEERHRDARTLVREVVEVARQHGAERLSWGVDPRPQRPDLDTELMSLAGEISGAMEICAYDIGEGPPPIPVPDDVTVRPLATRDDVRAKLEVDALVWGYVKPTDADIDQDFKNLGHGPFIAFHRGEPAGAGGYTLAGKVARLWGAGVLPHLRGKGIYRALLDARIKDALTRGVTLALVHANIDTSAPILRRLGFSTYGQRRIITIPTNVDGGSRSVGDTSRSTW